MVLILDCDALCYSVFFELGHLSNLSEDDEERKTGILFGFLKELRSLVKKFDKTRYIVFAWDSRKSLRKNLYLDYKGNRKVSVLTDADRKQFTQLRKEILPELGFVNILMKTGYEADDIIAATIFNLEFKKEPKPPFVIVSGDSDLYQLLSINTSMFKPRSKDEYFLEDFYKEWPGITPAQWAEVKSIAGCTTDNVAGVPKVGNVTAIKYLTGSLSGGTKAFAEIAKSKDIIDRNRRLVTLPFEDLDMSIRIRPYIFNYKGLRRICEDYGFKSILKDLDNWRTIFED